MIAMLPIPQKKFRPDAPRPIQAQRQRVAFVEKLQTHFFGKTAYVYEQGRTKRRLFLPDRYQIVLENS